MSRTAGEWKLPQPTDIKEDEEWVSIPRIARTVPFGYGLDKADSDILRPIPQQLDALEQARQHIKQYSYREVSNWLSTRTERYISHVGLRKRLAHEQKRKRQITSLRKWAEYAETAIEKAKELETERLGAKASAAE